MSNIVANTITTLNSHSLPTLFTYLSSLNIITVVMPKIKNCNVTY
jgi:hypothetical protein